MNPFPELTDAVKGLFSRQSAVQPLDLKGLSTFDDSPQAEWYARNGFRRLASDWGAGGRSYSGETVTVNAALNLSVVWACVRIISETLAFLPLSLLKQDGTSNKPATDHPIYECLKYSPNDEMTASTFRETRTAHYLLRGNAFAKINRRSGTGTAIGLDALKPEQVRVERERGGQQRLVYIVKIGQAPEKAYPVTPGKPHDILHIKGIGDDGLLGYSVIEVARQSMGTAMATERHVGSFWANGGRTPYYLELMQKMANDTALEKFRNDWEQTYSSPHRAPIMEPWVKYHPIGMNQRDAQVIESRQFSIPELCRWFMVSPHLVGDLARATFSNIEQLSLEFVKFTLQTHINRWEQELRRCVLTPEEKKQGYYFKHNVNALLRGDFATRMAGFATMLQNGIATQNEVRALEDMDPHEGGDDLHIQLNMQTLVEGVLQSQIDAAAKKLAKSPAAGKVQE